MLSEVNEAEISRFLKEAPTERIVRNCFFATFDPTQYPQHPDLHDMMQNHPMPEHDAREIADLATLLEPWNEQALVSGSFDNPVTQNGIAHFELGQIPDANMHLKEIAAFLIANYARQHIITLPRVKPEIRAFRRVRPYLEYSGWPGACVANFTRSFPSSRQRSYQACRATRCFKTARSGPSSWETLQLSFYASLRTAPISMTSVPDIGLSECCKGNDFAVSTARPFTRGEPVGGNNLSPP